MSASLDELIASANQAQAAGRLDEAEQLARTILQTDANQLHANLILGAIYAKRGQAIEAEKILSRVLEEHPNSFDAAYYMAVSLRNRGQTEEAVEFAQKAVDLNPEFPVALSLLGRCYLENDQFAKAESVLCKAAKLNPKSAPLQDAHGISLEGLGRLEEAIAAYGRSAELNPFNEDVLHRLGLAYLNRFEPKNAIVWARRLLKINPLSLKGQLLLANALMADGNAEAGLQAAKQASEQVPDSAAAALAVGQMMQALGKFEEAEPFLAKSIQLDPTRGIAYAAIVRGRRMGDDDRQMLDAMGKLASDPTLLPAQLGPLHYGLGKSYDELGQYEKAMRHFDLANQIDYSIKYGDQVYDGADYKAGHDALIRTFDRSRLEKMRDPDAKDGLPIFVVGMIRSGTTLVDQILSSHPEIGTAGEQSFWQANRAYAFNRRDGSVDADKLRELALTYGQMLRQYAPRKRRVIDKMPVNYAVLGLIYLAFPNARIIHVGRHPVDTCLSIYFTPNSARIDWAHNKKNIVFAYHEYLRLMDHWRSTLPSSQIFHIQYEDLVKDRERLTRQLVDFCGVEWADSCLYPEKNERTVATPSLWQVRQPVYTSSIDRWRNYEPWLGPFRDLL